jgi:hypothetical protein
LLDATVILVKPVQFLKESTRIVDTDWGIVRDIKLVQSANALPSIVVAVVGILTFIKLLHPKNIDGLTTVKLGRVTPVKLEQFKNVDPPMLVTLGGIVIVAKLEQLLNTDPPRDVTLGGIVKLCKLVQFWKTELGNDKRLLVLCEVVQLTIAMQSWNAEVPIVVIVLGMLILVNCEQPLNAVLPIVVSKLELLIVTVSNRVHKLNALLSMIVTESGTTTLLKNIQLLNEDMPIFVILGPSVTLFKLRIFEVIESGITPA